MSQPVFEAWVLYYSENQYDVDRTSFCGLNILKRYETSSPYVGYRTPTYEQDELREMTLDAVSGYHATHKRGLPSRLIRGRANSYEKDLDQRIQKLPRPVQSELNSLLGDRENATCNRFHRRDWTVVMMREEYRYKFATAEHEEVKKSKRFWKKGDKRPIHYFFILRGEDSKVATDDRGMHTATRNGNPWKRVDEKERREKQHARNIRRYGKNYIYNEAWYSGRPRDNFRAPPPSMPPPFGRVAPPSFPSPRVRILDREDTGNFPPVNPSPFGPLRCGNGLAPSFTPPPPPPPPPPGPFSCGPMPPPPPRFPFAPPAPYRHGCVCRNAGYYPPSPPPPPPPPPPPVMPIGSSSRPGPFFGNYGMYLPPSLSPTNPPLPRPASNFPMVPPPQQLPPHLRMTDCLPPRPLSPPDFDPFAAIPTDYTGSSRASLPPAPRLSNLTTPTTFSRVTSNHTGSSVVDPHPETSTPASPLPEQDEREDCVSEGASSRSASPGPPRRSVRSASPASDGYPDRRDMVWFDESAERY